ncbi:HD domain-containing phosphohydrolase [Hydrogenimonas sp. SS33]|uniref:HD domain-containing phosphohydrolase n=1 Tax=Hydrogenimonas leucolamina TaxID=2954236 RepID=UPI00336BE669
MRPEKRSGQLSFRTGILLVTLASVLGIAAVLIGLQYRYSKAMAVASTQQVFRQAVDRMTHFFQSEDLINKIALERFESDPKLWRNSAVDGPEKIEKLVTIAKTLPSFYAISIGYPDGSLFEVVNAKASDNLPQKFSAPRGTRWITIRIDGSGKKRLRFYDAALHLIGTRFEKSGYRLFLRPWYREALESGKTIRSAPYRFVSSKETGITYARKIADGTVVALDYTLSKLNNAMNRLHLPPSAEMVMFEADGTLIAATRPMERVPPLYTEILRSGERGKIVDEKGRYAMVTKLSTEVGRTSYLGFGIEKEAALRPAMAMVYESVAAAVGVALLAAMLVYVLAGRFVRPVTALMRENEKIARRHYDEVEPIESPFSELNALSDSLIAMSESIRRYERSLKEMMRAFIRMIADAIDAKSPYTGGHCKRVPAIATMLLDAAEKSDAVPFAGFKTTPQMREAFEMGAWLHDCGKITTPEFVVDKATKLETIYNRIHEIRTRFEVLWRDLDVAYCRRLLEGEEPKSAETWREKERQRLREDFTFVARCNEGSEWMDEADLQRLRTIAKRTWLRHFDDRLGLSETELARYGDKEASPLPAREPLLCDKPWHIVPRDPKEAASFKASGFKMKVPEHLYNFGELYNLSIRRGTLSEEERFKIEEHVVMTLRMLEPIPYPPGLEKIPEYAATHHEKLDCSGYPRGLCAKDLSIPDRIMAIADIFEALTAADRPYKKAKLLSVSLKIMASMVKEGHLDADLFRLFLTEEIYLRYARAYLKEEQIDEVDTGAILEILKGYS